MKQVTAGRLDGPLGGLVLGVACSLLVGWGDRGADGTDGAWPVTSGAAAGYVPDEACADCHEAIWDSYQHVAMAQAFRRGSADDRIEDLENAHYFHELSGNHYEMELRDGQLFQRRYRLDRHGHAYAPLERRVDWIVGSGKHARNYFYRTDLGELYQLPLVWYSQDGRWGMAPGYDKPDHSDFGRQVGRKCMSCHNAYPDVESGSDLFGQPPLFPEDLPEGIGCQRCHGPGAEHVRLAESDEASMELLTAAITNPANLPPAARDDLCNQCHLQPVATIEGFVQRFGTGTYSFRPGMLLEESQLVVDVDEQVEGSDHFEINHHVYRLARSRCYQESPGRLTCLTCHDPHRRPAPEQRAAHYRARCLGCHEPDVCSKNPLHMQQAGIAEDDCVGCHMPARRPREVVNVLMTDHRIRRELAPEEWTAPRREETWSVRGSALHRPERLEGDPHAELYGALAASNSGDPEAIRALEARLRSSDEGTFEAWFELGEKLFLLEAKREAAEAFRRCLELAPDLAVAHHKLGSTLASLGELEQALVCLGQALELDPDQADAHLVTAVVLNALERLDEAIPHLSRAIELRPHQFLPHLTLANLHARRGELDEAIREYRAARSADPRIASAHDNLGLALSLRGKWKAALRAWSRGLDCVPEDLSLNRRVAELLLTAPREELRSPDQALLHARRAVELDPGDPSAALLHALALLEMGDPRGAWDEAKRAGTLDADGLCWRLVGAQALFRLGLRPRARKLLALAGAKASGEHTEPVHAYIQATCATLRE